MIAELWVTPDGRMYYRLDGWHGFYVIVPDDDLESDTTTILPADAIQLRADGVWVREVKTIWWQIRTGP